MCAVLAKSLPPVETLPAREPTYDLGYTVDGEVDSRPDSLFLYTRLARAIVKEGTASCGKTLDVACGAGQMATSLSREGVETWGMDPSPEMLGLNRWLSPNGRVVLIRGIGETLPFRDATFDQVICKEALDHFLHPDAFMREAARILKPEGRLIIALSNYESLSCRLGRLRHRLAQILFRRPASPFRPYWQPPPTTGTTSGRTYRLRRVATIAYGSSASTNKPQRRVNGFV